MSEAPTIRLRINGEERELPGTPTVRELLVRLGVDDRQVAVERNKTLIPKAEFDGTRVADGDVLEIVTFVGGG